MLGRGKEQSIRPPKVSRAFRILSKKRSSSSSASPPSSRTSAWYSATARWLTGSITRKPPRKRALVARRSGGVHRWLADYPPPPHHPTPPAHPEQTNIFPPRPTRPELLGRARDCYHPRRGRSAPTDLRVASDSPSRPRHPRPLARGPGRPRPRRALDPGRAPPPAHPFLPRLAQGRDRPPHRSRGDGLRSPRFAARSPAAGVARPLRRSFPRCRRPRPGAGPDADSGLAPASPSFLL